MNWRTDAACFGQVTGDWDPWNGVDGTVGHRFDPADTRHAIDTCHVCPVQDECLADAMDTESPAHTYGIRGGLTAEQRASLRRSGTRRRAVAS